MSSARNNVNSSTERLTGLDTALNLLERKRHHGLRMRRVTAPTRRQLGIVVTMFTMISIEGWDNYAGGSSVSLVASICIRKFDLYISKQYKWKELNGFVIT